MISGCDGVGSVIGVGGGVGGAVATASVCSSVTDWFGLDVDGSSDIDGVFAFLKNNKTIN